MLLFHHSSNYFRQWQPLIYLPFTQVNDQLIIIVFFFFEMGQVKHHFKDIFIELVS